MLEITASCSQRNRLKHWMGGERGAEKHSAYQVRLLLLEEWCQPGRKRAIRVEKVMLCVMESEQPLQQKKGSATALKKIKVSVFFRWAKQQQQQQQIEANSAHKDGTLKSRSALRRSLSKCWHHRAFEPIRGQGSPPCQKQGRHALAKPPHTYAQRHTST